MLYQNTIQIINTLITHGGRVYEEVAPALGDVLINQWGFSLTVILPAIISMIIYGIGWRRLTNRGVSRFTRRHLWCFFSAMAVFYIAVQSPIDAIAEDFLLSFHMLQHFILWSIVPILIWCSEPFAPLMWGLPEIVRRKVIGPVITNKRIRAFFARLVHPAVAWPVFVVNMWFWHIPFFYDLALDNELVHELEHLAFMAAGLIFWWPALRPYPSRIKWSPWLLVPYFLLSGVQATLLSAIFCFAPEVIYINYLDAPRIIEGFSALNDQKTAGAFMWVCGSTVDAVALIWVTAGLLYGSGGLSKRGTSNMRTQTSAT